MPARSPSVRARTPAPGPAGSCAGRGSSGIRSIGGMAGTDVTPFSIDIPQADLDDLHDRLRRTRWPDPEVVGDWSQGIPLAFVQDLVAYWIDTYDWRASEKRLNDF